MRALIVVIAILPLIYGVFGSYNKLQCDYRSETFPGLTRKFRTCLSIAGLNITDPSQFLNNNPQKDIEFLKLENPRFPMNYFPKNFQEILPNLRGIDVQNVKLQEVKREDFSSLPNLTYINLSGNNITSIPNDLFKDNLKLRVIILNDNPIEEIYPETFKNLTKLKRLEINGRECSKALKDAKEEEALNLGNCEEIQVSTSSTTIQEISTTFSSSPIFEPSSTSPTYDQSLTSADDPLSDTYFASSQTQNDSIEQQQQHLFNKFIIVVVAFIIVQIFLIALCFFCLYRYFNRTVEFKPQESEYYAKSYCAGNFVPMGNFGSEGNNLKPELIVTEYQKPNDEGRDDGDEAYDVPCVTIDDEKKGTLKLQQSAQYDEIDLESIEFDAVNNE